MFWLFFVISSTFLFCLRNVAEKIVISKYVKNTTIYGYILITYLVYGAATFFLLPFADIHAITPSIILLVIFRSAQNLLFYYFWIKLMMDEEISRIMGILFLYPLVAFFLDYLFFKTQLSFIFYIGALLMTFSALLMSYKPNARIFVEKKHLFYMFIIILLWGIHGVLLKTITKTVDVQTFLFLDTALVLIIAVIITLFSKTIQHQMREFFSAQIISTQKILCLTIAGITIMYIIALLLSFKAYNLQKVSLIASFETIQPTFVFLIALFLSLFFSKVLKEEVDKKTIAYKIIALVLLSIGICLVVRSTNI